MIGPSDRRIGRFMLDLHEIERDPALCRAIMGKCIILRAECLWHRGYIEYEAICDDWPEIKIGDMIPTYPVIIHRTSAGNLTVFMNPKDAPR